jgi:hypothetical protein
MDTAFSGAGKDVCSLENQRAHARLSVAGSDAIGPVRHATCGGWRLAYLLHLTAWIHDVNHVNHRSLKTRKWWRFLS